MNWKELQKDIEKYHEITTKIRVAIDALGDIKYIGSVDKTQIKESLEGTYDALKVLFRHTKAIYEIGIVEGEALAERDRLNGSQL